MLREQILTVLSQGKFVSGEALGKMFGVTRAAIAKHIKAINEMGVDVYSVHGKGYRLSNPLVLLDKAVIEKQLQNRGLNFRVDSHAMIDSTNSFLMRKLPNNVKQGDICIAEYQSHGRGRRGRQWISPFGSHLYLSMYWSLEQGVNAAMGMSVAVALAIYDTIIELTGESVQLKWPNDVYWQGKKLAGILIELEGQPLEPSHSVIGIGLNINMPDKSAELIDQPWSALSQFSKSIDRNLLASELIFNLQRRLSEHAQSGLKTMIDTWNQLDWFIEQPVKIISGEKETLGICKGIDHNGALRLDVNGAIQTIYGGEVSLRGQE
ncbi:bifunctional biotin--[acetyl-CoA-carboxylase] ligase/biotin operon repressor BirA [Thalassotalea sp. LPB0316]|uniref:bifunctional biotin--[acetyl-CoA-carboxylase] ligase/biotin operon repressor BirA n=1 Tax=Thalassotalea sp. LPB0316 TaxID=2769490 RepID=UPI0018681B9C|nr:bifunctional biotin--[acetyl-CoA-carboxylase] ligase/biotin operon repressor BirA [Thalassotalea sp. LPB0316]QOL26151.1 bifunctional biotin--[acetyl-CoA-carboxylase] ligase/biotin operon repressor BirA [Thalassotalea sp. LPB0316]